MFRSFVGLGWE